MLNSGEKIIVFCTTKKLIFCLVLSEKKFLNETKDHNPPKKPFCPDLLHWAFNMELFMPF